MIASLMMYLRPETAEATGRYWAMIRDALRAQGIPAPERLSNDAEEFAVWTAPDLTLSQTCGMPYRLWLHDRVTLIGTPDFGVEGCPPGYYNSVFVVRANDPRETISEFRAARFTYNQTFSQSGYAAAYAHCSAEGFWFADRSQSHGHRNSAKTVAEGRADIAALDGVSWRLIQRYDAFAGGFLGYLDWSGGRTEEDFRRAMVYGSALGSYAVEAFSVDRLKDLTLDQVMDRIRQFREITAFELEVGDARNG